jgi:hypothetical protein
MAKDDDATEYPERGYTTQDVEVLRTQPVPRKSFLRRHWGKLTIAAFLVIPTVVFWIWAGIALGYTYSSGQRVGYVQKLSRRGWVCKTWEGELAMSNVPGSMPEKFYFSVRDDSIARLINSTEGRRVSLQYEQHVNVPSSCFGDTEYFVVGVRELP